MMKVVVFSCDTYSWLIPIFSHFYEKNWPDNPYQTVFVTETEKTKEVTTFCAGKLEWANRMIKYLNSCNDETFLLLSVDYIIEKKVDTNRIKRAEGLCKNNIGCVRLFPLDDKWSRFLFDTNIEGFKEYPLDKRYSISLQASIWQKEFLLEFLRKGETCWQTEGRGSRRIYNSKYRVIWADTAILSYRLRGYMTRGKVIEEMAKWVKENW